MTFEQNKSSGKIPSLIPLLGEVTVATLDDGVIHFIIFRGEGKVLMKHLLIPIVIPNLDQALVSATAIDGFDWHPTELAISHALESL